MTWPVDELDSLHVERNIVVGCSYLGIEDDPNPSEVAFVRDLRLPDRSIRSIARTETRVTGISADPVPIQASAHVVGPTTFPLFPESPSFHPLLPHPYLLQSTFFSLLAPVVGRAGAHHEQARPPALGCSLSSPCHHAAAASNDHLEPHAFCIFPKFPLSRHATPWTTTTELQQRLPAADFGERRVLQAGDSAAKGGHRSCKPLTP
jgi:hypothetical protein